MISNAASHVYQFGYCRPCWIRVSWGLPHDLAALLARQRFACDEGVLVLHLCAEETDHTISMVCGAHYNASSVSANLLEAPLAGVRQVPPASPVADDIAYREAHLAALDRNTRAICDALNDLGWQIRDPKGRLS